MNNQVIHTKNKLGEGLLFKVSRFKEIIKRTVPHKHDDYYELIFLSEGEGFHRIESENYLISAPECFFLKPGQLHYWQFTSVPKGFAVLFKESLFDPMKESDLIGLYRQLSENTRIKLEKENYPEQILVEILNEFNTQSDYSTYIINGLLRALFGKLLFLSDHNLQKSNLQLSLFDRFQQLLTKECPRLHKVADYAELLNTTPQNLNATCRKHSGRSASGHIAAQLLLEAKRYILHTENTINEIAYALSFSDPSHFVKFFRKHENLTPIQFRRKYFQ
jgi:AraC-like DNA-binding protein